MPESSVQLASTLVSHSLHNTERRGQVAYVWSGKKGGNAKPEANIAIPHQGMPWEGPDADANKDNPNYKC